MQTEKDTLRNRFRNRQPAKSSPFIRDVLKFIIIAAIIIYPVRAFIAQPFLVSGSSMFPTFENGQYLIVDELSYQLGEPKRGEVVVFRYPEDPSQYFIKRVIGLPGETVIIQDGNVSIRNDEYPEGRRLSEEYVRNMSSENLVTTLADDQYFVMGDNRIASSDSRYWGPVSEELIIGRSFVRLFPFGEAKVNPGAAGDMFVNE